MNNFQITVADVTKVYKIHLKRSPAASEVAAWTAQELDSRQLEAAIKGSDEYTERQVRNRRQATALLTFIFSAIWIGTGEYFARSMPIADEYHHALVVTAYPIPIILSLAVLGFLSLSFGQYVASRLLR